MILNLERLYVMKNYWEIFSFIILDAKFYIVQNIFLCQIFSID